MAKSTTPKNTDTSAEKPEATPVTTSKASTSKKAAPSKKAAASKATDSKAAAKKPKAAAKAPKAAAAKKSAAPKKPAAKARAKKATEPTQEEIARRAYELHQERGGQHGSHEDDWHRAEAELRGNAKK